MYFFFKRIFDVIGAVSLLLIMCVPMIIIACILFISQGSILFVQKRIGKNEKCFSIYKFQTMTPLKDTHAEMLSDDSRITIIGSFLRKTSLDELPQLFNILKGEMSFVGPRPLLVSYLPLYNTIERKRHLERPGLTGLAQVNGRNNISWQKKFSLDVFYVEHVTFQLDLKIILRTIYKVMKKSDINLDGHATAVPFEGNHKKQEH